MRRATPLVLVALLLPACRRGEVPTPREAQPPPVGGATAAPQAGPGQVAPTLLPLPDLGYNAREGRALYRHYCLTCHGDQGHGDGFNAYNLDPKPRDLADPAFQTKRSDEDLTAIIGSGGGAAGLSTSMPPWGRTLNERQIRNIVDYLRVLPKSPE